MVTVCYRNRNEILYSILKSIKEQRAAKRTRVMYDSRTAYPQLANFLERLESHKLIIVIDDIIFITPKGLEYMTYFEEIELLQCVAEPKPLNLDVNSKDEFSKIEMGVQALMKQGITNSYEIAKIMRLPRGTIWHRVLKIKKEQSTRRRDGL